MRLEGVMRLEGGDNWDGVEERWGGERLCCVWGCVVCGDVMVDGGYWTDE